MHEEKGRRIKANEWRGRGGAEAGKNSRKSVRKAV